MTQFWKENWNLHIGVESQKIVFRKLGKVVMCHKLLVIEVVVQVENGGYPVSNEGMGLHMANLLTTSKFKINI